MTQSNYFLIVSGINSLFCFHPFTKNSSLKHMLLSHTSGTHGRSRIIAVSCRPSPTFQSWKLKSSVCQYLQFNLSSWTRLDGMFTSSEVMMHRRRMLLIPHCLQGDSKDLPLKVAEWECQDSISEELISTIRSKLCCMADGEISVSPYDTAWVSLVEDSNKAGVPQFPTALDWISKNQHTDGSWGDKGIFSVYDRIINTLACIVALKTWDTSYPFSIERGLKFILDNMRKLEEEKVEQMLVAFELTFPNLLEMAKKLGIEVPDDSSFIQSVYAMRNLKFERIPKDTMYSRPTSLLYTLEGIGNLDFEKLLRFQCEDGSFFFSPSSTAFALMQTGDKNCLNYLEKVVQGFQGAAPCVYPLDLFEHIWVIDRLERLGISRHFLTEIKDSAMYVNRYWTQTGIGQTRNSLVKDLDDTAMGFRVLRLNGYDVCTDVLKNFQHGKEFFCITGQTSEAVTVMFNLFRTSQLQFPGETILEEAREFSSDFLREKQACGKITDKWIITKDLHGEVSYALDVPWYASLARLEARFYIQHYGGDNDVWIAKTLFRLYNVSSNTYLELAKLDYNECQALHQQEWDSFEKWYYESSNLKDLGIGRRNVLFSYFLAASSIFEPERYKERLAWGKTSILIESIVAYFNLDEEFPVRNKKSLFIDVFKSNIPLNINLDEESSDSNTLELDAIGQELVRLLLEYIREFSLNLQLQQGVDSFPYLCKAWEKWIMTVGNDKLYGDEGDLLVQTINMSLTKSYEGLSCQPMYQELAFLTNKLCNQLRLLRRHPTEPSCNELNMSSVGGKLGEVKIGLGKEIEADMQQLVMLVLKTPWHADKIERDTKQTFLSVVRSFYYSAYCDSATVDHHIAKVLFEKVE